MKYGAKFIHFLDIFIFFSFRDLKRALGGVVWRQRPPKSQVLASPMRGDTWLHQNDFFEVGHKLVHFYHFVLGFTCIL